MKSAWKWFDGITLRKQMHTSELPDSVIDSKGAESNVIKEGSCGAGKSIFYPSETQITAPSFTSIVK